MTCMTPRAFAPETIELLNPLSCQATAAAREGETPYWAAIDCTSEAPRRVAVGSGAAAGTTCVAGAGSAARGGVGDPLGSLITVPASSGPSRLRPFMAAMSAAETPAVAARPDRVSPTRTVYPPIGAGAAEAA